MSCSLISLSFISRPVITKSFGAALLLIATTALGNTASVSFDLSPEQQGLVRATADATLIKAIPANTKFAQTGKFTVAVAPDTPPIAAFATDNKTIIGFDPNVAQVVADRLGLTLELVPVAWADWPLGLISGKYDAVISNVGVTEERKEKFDFSTYRKGLHGFFVRPDSKIKSITEPKDIAGLKIVVGSGTAQERILLEWNRLNKEQGLQEAELQYYDDEAASDLALQSGRVDVVLGPNAYQTYQVSRGVNKLAIGTLSAAWPIVSEVGITTRKDSGFGAVLTQTLESLIKDGTYTKIATRWHLESEALAQSSFNPQGLPKYAVK